MGGSGRFEADSIPDSYPARRRATRLSLALTLILTLTLTPTLTLAVTRTLTRSSTKEAAAALKSFANRKFDGRVVAVSHLPEADFHALKDGE